MTDPLIAQEYVLARRALLDVLELLIDHLSGLTLVGAQAVYLHAPAETTRQPTYTTDGDLVIDPSLLADHPDIARTLRDAGYRSHSSPGTFFAPNGIAIDLMVPSAAAVAPGRRSAALTGHGKETARRTSGLEVALIDSSPLRIESLELTDPRTVELLVASPAALVVAKLTKLAERIAEPRRDRSLSKDAGDLLRLLRFCNAELMGARLRILSDQELASGVITDALVFLRQDVTPGRSRLVDLALADNDGREPEGQVETALRVLAGRLLAEFHA